MIHVTRWLKDKDGDRGRSITIPANTCKELDDDMCRRNNADEQRHISAIA